MYRADTGPALIPQWLFGPDGRTMPACISEARAGGHFRFDWTNGSRSFHATGEYIAATPFSRFEHVERMFLPDRTPENHVITEFQTDGTGTLMTMRMLLPDTATRDAMRTNGMTLGMEVSYARLDDQTLELTAQAVRPTGSGRSLARQQAVTVLARRQAMVIGPTPPGTGVMAPATAAALA